MKTLQSVSLKNFKGMSHVDIDINGKNYYIVGPNGAGKTTILQAIWYALQGKCGFGINKKKDRFRFLKPDERAAASEVRIFDSEINSDVIIKRSFTKTTETVEINTQDGQPLDPSYLEGILDHFTYDIQKFATMSPQDQAKLFGIDTSSIDEEIKSDEKILSDLNKKKLELQATQRNKDRELLEKGSEIIPGMEDPHQPISSIDTNQLQQKISDIYAFNAKQTEQEQIIATSRTRIDELEALLLQEKTKFNSLLIPEPLIDHSEIEKEISKAQEINLFVGRQKENQQFHITVESTIEDWKIQRSVVNQLYSQRVEKIQEGKSIIEAAGLDTENLDFDEKGGLLIGGRYLNEDFYSTGELIKKAVVIINMFKKPEFPLFLIRNGSLLDQDDAGKVKIFEELEQLGAQFICEMVGTDKVDNGILLTQEIK